jgi:hypothetical protein
MPAKYDVLSQTVEALMAQPSAQFKIPPFQRRYAWGAEEIGQLLDDLFGESTSTELPYFLGSIVLARQEGVDLTPELVLDGQQRLTTLSLLISVLIDKTREAGKTDADWNKIHLFSRSQKGKQTPKVILQPDDAKVFEILIDQPRRFTETALKATSLGEAIARIFALLEDFAESPQYKDSSNPYEEMLSRLIYGVEFVKITAPSERDAFRLFETLNDRGLALSAADLIKNKLFSRCEEELDDAIESWSNLLLLTKDDDVVNFLRSYWIAFEGFARKRGLYDLYKNRIDQMGSTEATLFVLDLEDVAKSYEQIVTPNLTRSQWGPEVAAVLDRLSNSYRARSCRPVLLSFAKSRPNDMERIAKLCAQLQFDIQSLVKRIRTVLSECTLRCAIRFVKMTILGLPSENPRYSMKYPRTKSFSYVWLRFRYQMLRLPGERY